MLRLGQALILHLTELAPHSQASPQSLCLRTPSPPASLGPGDSPTSACIRTPGGLVKTVLSPTPRVSDLVNLRVTAKSAFLTSS